MGSYSKMPVICCKLDRVPGLSNEAKTGIRKWLQKNKSKGAHNIPRRFDSTKTVKCTVLSMECFSEQTQALLSEGKQRTLQLSKFIRVGLCPPPPYFCWRGHFSAYTLCSSPPGPLHCSLELDKLCPYKLSCGVQPSLNSPPPQLMILACC